VTDPPVFLSVDDVLFVHARQFARFGGAEGLRDRAALASAVGIPQAGFGGHRLHPDLFAMAAAYAFHIAQAQAFIDGNRRTGLVSAILFLRINDLRVRDPDQRLYDAMIAVAEKRLDKAGLAAVLRELATGV
jgi:death-on-curing protein